MAGRLPHAKLCAMLKVVQNHPSTLNMIARKTGVGVFSVRLWMRSLHAARCVHVAKWTREGRAKTWVAVYAIGDGDDAKLSDIRLTKNERQRKYREIKHTLEGAWKPNLGV
ncbi:MAG: hypothetical protein VW362_08980 [Candidatus Nanopelagicales bacterium]